MQLALVEEIRSRVVAQQYPQDLALFYPVPAILVTCTFVFGKKLQMQELVERGTQLVGIGPYPPGDIVGTGQIKGNLDVVTVAEVHVRDIAVAHGRIDLPVGDGIELLFVRHPARPLHQRDTGKLLAYRCQVLPERRAAVDHDALTLQVGRTLQVIAGPGDKHLLPYRGQRDRERDLSAPALGDAEIRRDQVTPAFEQSRNHVREALDRDQHGLQALAARETLRRLVLCLHRPALPRQVEGTTDVGRDEDTQAATLLQLRKVADEAIGRSRITGRVIDRRCLTGPL